MRLRLSSLQKTSPWASDFLAWKHRLYLLVLVLISMRRKPNTKKHIIIISLGETSASRFEDEGHGRSVHRFWVFLLGSEFLLLRVVGGCWLVTGRCSWNEGARSKVHLRCLVLCLGTYTTRFENWSGLVQLRWWRWLYCCRHRGSWRALWDSWLETLIWCRCRNGLSWCERTSVHIHGHLLVLLSIWLRNHLRHLRHRRLLLDIMVLIGRSKVELGSLVLIFVLLGNVGRWPRIVLLRWVVRPPALVTMLLVMTLARHMLSKFVLSCWVWPMMIWVLSLRVIWGLRSMSSLLLFHNVPPTIWKDTWLFVVLKGGHFWCLRGFYKIREVLLLVKAPKLLLVCWLPLGLIPFNLRIHLLFINIVCKIYLTSLLGQMQVSMSTWLFDLPTQLSCMFDLLFCKFFDVISWVIDALLVRRFSSLKLVVLWLILALEVI